MRKRIFKYPVEIARLQIIDMPEGAEILSLQVQSGIPCIWALVEDGNKRQSRRFRIFGTGAEINSPFDLRFIGTWQEKEGAFVFHLFEEV